MKRLALFLIVSCTVANGQQAEPRTYFGSPILPLFGSGPSDSRWFDEVIEVPPAATPSPTSAVGPTQINVRGPAGRNSWQAIEYGEVEVNVWSGDYAEVDVGGVEGVASEFNLMGGSIDRLRPAGWIETNLWGGAVGQLVSLFTVTNVRGGTIEGLSWADNAVMNVYGGNFRGSLFVDTAEGELNLFGADFRLDGEPIDGIAENEATVVEPPNGSLLTGTLTDGSPFSYVVNPSDNPFDGPVGIYTGGFGPDFGTITVTLVPIPEPSAAVMLAALIFGAARPRDLRNV